ncbi:unnamed protein product [Mesocestoides corti]|uniref:ZNF598/HEL2 PAH domain-containing protein n=1 Tax=Mesocestoides corti TaxID=53468 RepID=A0A0R3UID7_MESCO|nr:unnamed protein product [Mesocestoides corti]
MGDVIIPHVLAVPLNYGVSGASTSLSSPNVQLAELASLDRQRELFDHYKAAHFVCPECEVVGRMTCYASNDQLGLHRMHEHPNESQGDPSLWEPLQIRFSTHGLISQHANTRNNRRTAYAHEGGDEEAPPPESYNSQSRGPMPEEWTAMDFPSLSGGPPSSQEKQATSKPHRRTGRSLASVVGSGHSVLVNSEDFPSLPSSSTTSSAPPQPQKDWAAEKRVAASSASEKQPAGSQRDVLPPSREDFPSLAGGGTSTNTPATNWSAKVSSSAAVVAGNPAKQRHQPVPTENDFPSLSASNGSSNSLVSGGKPLLPPYHPPSKDNQQPKSTKGKKNNRLTEPPPQPAPDLLPFSPSIDKARKSRWWNEADNSGALARLNLNEEGSTSTNAHILVVDSLEPVVSSSESVPKKPVDFSINEFPSLCGDKKANAKAVPKAPKTKTKVSQPPKKKVAPSTEGSVKTTSLDDVEDTETVLFKDNIYTQPQHYAEKNRELIRVAQETLSNSNVKNSFSRFADLSRLFRHGQLTAQAYVQGLDGLFGRMGDADEAKDGQFHWLSSMIALLPEVGLQRALLRALRGAAAPRVPHCASPARAHAVAPPPWAKLVTSRLQTCSSCGQVLCYSF